MSATFVDIAWRDRRVRIEHRWIDADRRAAPTIVFLHEGLGSCSAWRDFPDTLCRHTQARGLVYSRPGYGESTPRAPGESWKPDFMHRQAHEVLPALFDALGLDGSPQPPWLFGHSDGASIALLAATAAARGAGPTVSGLVLMAPHVMVEDVALLSIEQARQRYLHGDLRQRLGAHHADPDSAFWGWNEAWLNPAFAAWSIEEDLSSIRCPVLVIQGQDDEYGTLAQVDAVVDRIPGAEHLVLPHCRHSPHRDQPAAVLQATAEFIDRHRPRDARPPQW